MNMIAVYRNRKITQNIFTFAISMSSVSRVSAISLASSSVLFQNIFNVFDMSPRYLFLT